MIEKLQIILAKSFYYQGAYDLRRVAPEQVEIELPELRLYFEAVNLEVQLMVEDELYMTFDELKSLQVEQYDAGSKRLLSGT